MPSLCGKVGSLLDDSQPSVRQLAIDTLVSLHKVFGDSMMEELKENDKISLSKLKALESAILSIDIPLSVNIDDEDRTLSHDFRKLSNTNVNRENQALNRKSLSVTTNGANKEGKPFPLSSSQNRSVGNKNRPSIGPTSVEPTTDQPSQMANNGSVFHPLFYMGLLSEVDT
jgi:hypothetical protein